MHLPIVLTLAVLLRPGWTASPQRSLLKFIVITLWPNIKSDPIWPNYWWRSHRQGLDDHHHTRS
jgi:hypothetical protein